jgi:hypothetical protein
MGQLSKTLLLHILPSIAYCQHKGVDAPARAEPEIICFLRPNFNDVTWTLCLWALGNVPRSPPWPVRGHLRNKARKRGGVGEFEDNISNSHIRTFCRMKTRTLETTIKFLCK